MTTVPFGIFTTKCALDDSIFRTPSKFQTGLIDWNVFSGGQSASCNAAERIYFSYATFTKMVNPMNTFNTRK